MSAPEDRRAVVESGLHEHGFVRVPGPLDPAAYRSLASDIGEIVGEERIAIRPGAHAYVAKPGPVPLHTDQPEVAIISWLCERQDEDDGASLLFDMRPFVTDLTPELRRLLHEVHLMTPPISGGPATLRWPVLRRTATGEAVLCSPWLRSASPVAEHVEALEEVPGTPLGLDQDRSDQREARARRRPLHRQPPRSPRSRSHRAREPEVVAADLGSASASESSR